MSPHDSRFQLNDIVLEIPPENISIDRSATVKQYKPVRTRGSAKVRNPSAVMSVNVQTKFVGVDAINNQLRYLIAQLRLTPFCYVDNQYLRDAILGEEQSHQTIALALQNLTVSTVQDHPDTLNVIFSFVWFNYKPYSQNFLFKTDIQSKAIMHTSTSPGSNVGHESANFTPFQLFYQNELRKLKKVTLANSNLSLSNLEFGLSAVALENETTERVVDYDKLRELTQEVNNFVKIAEDATQSMGTDAMGQLNIKEFVGRLSGVILAADVQEVLFAISQFTQNVQTISPNSVRLKELIDVRNDILEDGALVFKGTKWLEFPASLMGTKNVNRIRGKTKDGVTPMAKLFYRARTLTTDNNNFSSGIVATSITVNFNHKLALIPLQGHPYPTAQSMGSDDFEFNVRFACLDDDSNRRFTTFWNSNQNALQFARMIPQDILSINVSNELFQLFGVRQVLLTGKHDSTVPSHPGLYTHEMVLTENSFDILSTEQFIAVPSSFKLVRKLIWKAIWNNIRVKNFVSTTHKTILNFETDTRDEASRIFLSRLIHEGVSNFDINSIPINRQSLKLLTLLSETKEDIRGTKLTGIQLLSGLTDDQVLAIEGFASHLIDRSRLSAMAGSPLASLDREQLKMDREEVKKFLVDSEKQRKERLIVVREAIRAISNATSEANAHGGIKSVSGLFLITTFDGTKIDLGPHIKDPVLLSEFQKLVLDTAAAASVPDTGEGAFSSTSFGDNNSLGNFSAFRAFFENLERELVQSGSKESPNKKSDFFSIFDEWGKWATAIADDVIDKYITLPLFKEAYDKYLELDVRAKGNLYRDMDFGAIKNDIAQAAKIGEVDPESLDFEPDFYFWNDSLLGFNGLLEEDMVKVINLTRDYANQAIKDTTNWYQQTYINKVNPQFQTFLDGARDVPERILVPIEGNSGIQEHVIPGLSQITKPQSPRFDNSWTTTSRLSPGTFLSSINNPLDIDGNISYLTHRKKDSFNKTPSLQSQPLTVDQRQNQTLGAALAEGPANQAAHGAWINPLPGAQITSVVGWRKLADARYHTFHQGTDLAYTSPNGQNSTAGQPVYSTLGGKVINVANQPSGAGLFISIRSAVSGDPEITSVTHTYMHLSRTMVSTSDYVTPGQIIGLAGNTGHGTGAHLHFEIQVDGKENTFVYPFDHRLDTLPEKRPEGAAGDNRTIIKRPGFIAIGGATHPQMPNAAFGGITTGLTSFRHSAMSLDLDQQRISGYRMNRAYPSIYLAFIEEDLDNEHIYKFDDYFSFASIVSLYCVKDREVAADYAVMELTNLSGILSNRKFEGTFNELNPIYTGKGEDTSKIVGASDPSRNDFASINTEEENRFESLVLRDGIKVEIRLGYSNNPDKNEIVFIGRIVGTQFSESDDVVQVELQSLATELVQDIKGLDRATVFDGIFKSDAHTGPLLEELIASPECVSFGFWERGAPDKNTNRSLLTDRYTWNPAPSSDNIFAPFLGDADQRKFFLGDSILTKAAFIGVTAGLAIGTAVAAGAVATAAAPALLATSAVEAVAVTAAVTNVASSLNPSDTPSILRGIYNNLSYYMYQTTIWDVFKEMEHRHPDCISSPVPYVEKLGGRTRMTMYFGNPDWLYFSRDPTGFESSKTTEIRERVSQLKNLVEGQTDQASRLDALQDIANTGLLDGPTLNKIKVLVESSADSSKIEEQLKAVNDNLTQKQLTDALTHGSIRPFRRYHLVTSKQHIIANNIRVKSSNVMNAVTIKYAADGADSVTEGKDNAPEISDIEEMTITLDPLIPNEYIRESVYTYPNCQGEAMAKRYAVSHLQKACWSIYQGDLIVLGNPSMKPYDIVYVYDEYSDMYGPVQIRRITHMFDNKHGFISIITPDLVTTVTEGTMLSELQAMGLMAERYLGFKDVITPGATIAEGVHVSPLKAFIADKALGIASFFGAKKLLFVTQFGNPVRIHPLIKNGQAMVAGFGPPGVRENEFIINDINEWVMTRSKAVSQSIDDFSNMFKNRQGLWNNRGTILAGDDISVRTTGVKFKNE